MGFSFKTAKIVISEARGKVSVKGEGYTLTRSVGEKKESKNINRSANDVALVRDVQNEGGGGLRTSSGRVETPHEEARNRGEIVVRVTSEGHT